ncbi:hypothetical protein ACFIOY_37345 [Bradyrhizobium sp. TZ2]
MEALPRSRPNDLRSVNSFPQAEHGALTGAIDRRLDRVTGLDGYRIKRAG